MNKDELLELGLSEELADKVLGKYEKMIPYNRFKEVIEEKNTYKAQLEERDTQLKELAKSNKDNENLQIQIKTLQETNKKQTEEYEANLSKIKLDNIIDLELTKAGVHSVKSARAELELDKLSLKDGVVDGLLGQIETLKKEKEFLFKTTEPINVTGIEPKVSQDPTPNPTITLGSALKGIYSNN